MVAVELAHQRIYIQRIMHPAGKGSVVIDATEAVFQEGAGVVIAEIEVAKVAAEIGLFRLQSDTLADGPGLFWRYCDSDVTARAATTPASNIIAIVEVHFISQRPQGVEFQVLRLL